MSFAGGYKARLVAPSHCDAAWAAAQHGITAAFAFEALQAAVEGVAVKLVVVLTGHTAREPVVMHPRVWDHEVPLVMSQVIQATGRRILHTWLVWLHLMFTFTYSGEPLFCSAFHGDFRLFATWRSDSALGSESSKKCPPMAFHPS